MAERFGSLTAGEQFLTGASAGQQADTSAKKARSSSGLIVIAAAQDDTRHWIETGRLYERLALTLTARLSASAAREPASTLSRPHFVRHTLHALLVVRAECLGWHLKG